MGGRRGRTFNGTEVRLLLATSKGHKSERGGRIWSRPEENRRRCSKGGFDVGALACCLPPFASATDTVRIGA